MHLLGSGCRDRHGGATDGLAVHGQGSLAGARGIDHIAHATPFALDVQLGELRGQMRFDAQAIECGLHTQQMLRDI